MVLVDTNVLVYAVDASDRVKNRVAAETLATLGRDSVCVSTQVLSEYANVVTHPSKKALAARVVIPDVIHMGTALRVLPVNLRTVVAALEARERWQLAYYDAQIWATAALNAIPVVLSEDFAHDTTLGAVRFLNPFAKDFDIEDLR